MQCFKMKYFVVFVIFFLNGIDAVIYRLNDSDYARMPPVIHLDSYEVCQLDTDAMYCNAEFALVSNKPSPLLDMIKEYSEHHVAHYNHTKLRYGICVTQTCKEFYKENSVDLGLTLEACLNKTLSEKYDLNVKIEDKYYCVHPGYTVMNIDNIDIIVGVVCLIIVLINIVGSICEISYRKSDMNTGMKILLCFSIKRNWKKLTYSPTDEHPRLKQLKGLHGIRTINMCLMICAHAMLPIIATIKNPQFLQEVYTTRPFSILLNGMLVMHTFLMMSSFLLIYKWQLSSNKQTSWCQLPKYIMIRWLRLTPGYALVLALTATWFRHLSSGPLWGKFVSEEMKDCRQYWWQHILYVNNYLDNTACMRQTWYLAVDMQLYVFAVIVYLSCKTSRSKKVILSTLFLIGTIIPALHVYFQDLEGIQIISPELILSIFSTDRHFNFIYKRTHTNLTGYVIGIGMGYLVYHWQNQQVDFKKYQRLVYRLLYQSFFSLAMLCCYSGYIFYDEAPPPSLYVSMVYAAFSKPVFGLLIGSLIIGCIFKIEGLYRCILEWRGWTIPSRLSYSAYLLHVVLIRSYVASITQTIEYNYSIMFGTSFNILIKSYVVAIFFWLLVETPINNVVKLCLETKTEDKNTNVSNRTTKTKES